MPESRNVPDVDPAKLFPTLPADGRESRREFLDRYFETAYRIFTRLERERKLGIDQSEKSS